MGVGDAAYHGKPLLVAGATITTRLRANAALYAPAPPRTGTRGRPRRNGDRLGTPAQIAATAQWHTTTVSRYGEQVGVQAALRTAVQPLPPVFVQYQQTCHSEEAGRVLRDSRMSSPSIHERCGSTKWYTRHECRCVLVIIDGASPPLSDSAFQ